MNNEQCKDSAAWLREVTEDEAFKKTLTVTCSSCNRKLKAKQDSKRTWEGNSQTIIDWWRLPYHGTVEPMSKAEAQEQLPGYFLTHYLDKQGKSTVVWYAAYREMIPGFVEEEATAAALSWEHLVEKVKAKTEAAPE